jgi:alkanesulfonate monooxygenase SsuD/methylene tetrahydromethanopterin reductase-like flavin-dependent oxidoreductase (luciferase family)
MRQLWTSGVATLDGKYYHVDGAIGHPRPVQAGGIPFWIAGGGEKRTLRIAARYANCTNFSDGRADEFARKSQILADHCRDVGSDFDAITRSVNFNVVIGETAKDVADRLAWIHAQYEPLVPAEQLAAQDKLYAGGPLVGTPEQIIERLRELAALGMSYAITNFRDAAYDRSSIELFAREVIPALT